MDTYPGGNVSQSQILSLYMLPDSGAQLTVTVVKGGGYEKDNELTSCGGTYPGGNVLILVCHHLFISSWGKYSFLPKACISFLLLQPIILSTHLPWWA